MEDRLPPNEYSEYFGPAATLHPPVVREKENHNTPRYLEQVPLLSRIIFPVKLVSANSYMLIWLFLLNYSYSREKVNTSVK